MPNRLQQLHRRFILRGLGGAAIAAPFLSSIAERAAKAAGEPVAAPPKRLILFFTHYGCLTDRFFPLSSNSALTAASFAGLSTEPLGAFASKLLLPRGIRAMNQWAITNGTGATYGQGVDPHVQVTGSYFTCAPVSPNKDEVYDELSLDFPPKATAPSLDHVCAKQVSPDGTPLYLRLGGFSPNYHATISWADANDAFTGLGSVRQVYQQISGLFLNPNAPSPDDRAVLLGKSVLDLVEHDLDTLARIDMSQADKQKLAAWKELLHQTTSDLGKLCDENAATALGLTNATALEDADAAHDPSTKLPTGIDLADLYSNVTALAAACNTNPVILLHYPPSQKYTGIEGVETDSHSLSHRVGTAFLEGDCLTDANAMLEKIDNFYARKFAYLIGQLDSLSEGEGTVLDHSAAVWFQEMSDGLAHNLNNMPIIQAGSCGGYFKLGQSINVDDVEPTRGNGSVHCQTEGAKITMETFMDSGTDPALGNAPINKYFCSLMNAIGVKGGPDGFPAVGGTERVTHYGMYDKTADFFGGGTNPPQINDPGEFEQLRGSA